MQSSSQSSHPDHPRLAWSIVALAGLIAPAAAIVLLADAPSPQVLLASGGAIVAIGLMGAGMIAAAAAGRFWTGAIIAIVSGAALVLLALALGMAAVPHPLSATLAIVIATISFAARGLLFATSAARRGWWIALFVVAGEAAIVITAAVEPGALPDWLLALLPAQWATMAIQSALTGTGALAAGAALLALAGTAAATLLVVQLWPRRWPYLVMFTTWLGLSALVYYHPV